MSTKAVAILALSFVMLLVFVYGTTIIYFSWPISFGNVDKAGVFGDSFGVLTSLFSGLAFAGIILTILLQREELRLQREELEKTREEFKMQNLTLKKQNFETTFFQMLRLHHEIVLSISVKDPSGSNVYTGRDCFSYFYSELKDRYTYKQRDHHGGEMDLIEEKAYPMFWEKNQSKLGHYFRHLYTIFKFINASEINNKRFYSNIVRAQLSDQELLVLFYNCLSKYGKEKFKPLAECFALFNNLPTNHLITPNHQSLFDVAAFGNNNP